MTGDAFRPAEEARHAAAEQLKATRGEPDGAVVLDPGALARIREVQAPGEPDLLIEMIAAFFATAPGHVAQMSEALALGDIDRLATAAHSLKSGAAYLGAHELQLLCVQLETRGRSGAIAGRDDLIDSLRAIFAQTRAAINAELVRHKLQAG